MSSYIKFLFSYLFEPAERLQAELDAAEAGAARRPGAANGATCWARHEAAHNNSQSKLWPPKCLEFASEIVREQRTRKGTAPTARDEHEIAHGQQQSRWSWWPNSWTTAGGGGGLSEQHLIGRAVQMASSGDDFASHPAGRAPADSSANSKHSGRRADNHNDSARWSRRPTTDAQQQQQQHPNELEDLIRSALEEAASKVAGASGPEVARPSEQANNRSAAPPRPNGERQQYGAAARYRELQLGCLNQLQLRDYYAGYDIFIGLRIGSTLSLLFVVFILFVIYKTGCRAERPSQLQLASAAAKRKRQRAPKRPESTRSDSLASSWTPSARAHPDWLV